MAKRHDIGEQSQGVKSWPKVAVIVLNYNGWADTIECLESLQRITYPNYQIIVVDNGSTDGSVDKIKAWARGEIPVESKFFDYDPSTKPVQWIEYDRETAEEGGIPKKEAELERVASNQRILIIRIEENLGYAGGNNIGIKYVLAKEDSKYICILNNDTVVEPDFLKNLMDGCDGKTGLCGPVIYEYQSPDKIWSSGGKFNYFTGFFYNDKKPIDKKTKYTFFLSGTCWLMNAKMIQEIGFIDEGYFLYAEDVDFCFKLRKKKLKLKVVPNSVIYHKVSSSTGESSPTMYYYFHRSKLRFINKNYTGIKKFFYLYLNLMIRYLRVMEYLLKNEENLAKSILKAIKEYKNG